MGKRILVVIHHLGFGGSERAASELANYFAKSDVDVTILLMANKEKAFKTSSDINVIFPDNKIEGKNSLHKLLILLKEWREAVKRIKPDVIFVLGGKTFINLATIGLDSRLVYGIRTSPTRPRFERSALKTYIYDLVNKVLSFNVDGTIVQTEGARKYLAARKGKKNVVCIPNSIRNLKDHQVKRENIVLSVGRLSIEKGHRFLIEAFYQAKLRGWILILVGDGPQRENLEELCDSLGISESVRFEGFKSDVDYYMQKAKIFALPSLYEGFPNALVEAMANGMACISFDCEMGPSEIIRQGKNGFLVKEKDVDTLKQRLQELANNENLREEMSSEAKKVREEYSLDSIGKRYLEYLLPTNTVTD